MTVRISDRHHRPGHFEQRVVRGLRRRRVRLGVELDDDDEQQREDENGDGGDDDEQDIVEPDDLLHHRRSPPAADPISHGCGWAASAAPAPAGQADENNRQGDKPLEHLHRRIRSFDEKKSAVSVLPNRAPQLGFTASATKRGAWAGAAGQGEIPASQTTIPAQSQCTKSSSAMRQRAFCGFLEKAATGLRDRGQSYDIDRIGRFARQRPAAAGQG